MASESAHHEQGGNMDTVALDRTFIDDRFPAYVAGGLWQPTRTGDYTADCQHGRQLADHIADQVCRDRNPLHLSIVARSIIESGRWEAVEIGLFSRLGALLV